MIGGSLALAQISILEWEHHYPLFICSFYLMMFSPLGKISVTITWEPFPHNDFYSLLAWACSFFLKCIKSPSVLCLLKLFVSPFFYTNVSRPFKDRNPKLYIRILFLWDFLWMGSSPQILMVKSPIHHHYLVCHVHFPSSCRGSYLKTTFTYVSSFYHITLLFLKHSRTCLLLMHPWK